MLTNPIDSAMRLTAPHIFNRVDFPAEPVPAAATTFAVGVTETEDELAVVTIVVIPDGVGSDDGVVAGSMKGTVIVPGIGAADGELATEEDMTGVIEVNRLVEVVVGITAASIFTSTQ